MYGKQIRMERIMDRKTGNAVIVQMDHGISVGPLEGLIDMQKAVDDVSIGGATAVLMHKGLIRYSHRMAGEDVGLILHLSASTDLGPTTNSKVLVATIDEAIKCRETGEEKVILFCLSGHGLIDMASYDKYLAGDLVNYQLSDEDIQKNL